MNENGLSRFRLACLSDQDRCSGKYIIPVNHPPLLLHTLTQYMFSEDIQTRPHSRATRNKIICDRCCLSFIFVAGHNVSAIVAVGERLYFATAQSVEVINVDGSNRKKLVNDEAYSLAVDLKEG